MSKITVKELQVEFDKLVHVKILKAKKLPTDLDKALDAFKAIVVDIEPSKQVKGSQDRAEAYNDIVEFYNTNVHPLRPDDEEEATEESEEEEEEVAEEEEEELAEEEEEPEPKKPAKGKAPMKPAKLATSKVKAPAAKKAVGNGGGRGRRAYTEDSKIVVKKKGSPFREGSGRQPIFDIIVSSKTVGEAEKALRKKGLRFDSWDFNKAVETGHIVIK